MTNWKQTTLGEVGRIVTGKTPPTILEEYYGGNIPFVTPRDMDCRKTIDTTERYLTEEGAEAVKGSYIPAGAIMVSCIGSVGKVAVAKKDCVTNQQINSIIVDDTNYSPDFIYYNLSHRQKEFQNLSGGGSALPILNKGHFALFNIICPPLPEQKAIAAVLSSFDDKIELLRRQNKTLEQIAQTIFKEWFVNFKVNGEKLKVNSKTGLPDGWRMIPLSEIAETINGYSYKGDELIETGEEALVTLKSFDRNGGFQIRGFKPFIGKPKPEQEVFVGDLVVAHTDLTQDAEVLGNPALIYNNGGYKKMFMTMDLVKVKPKKKEISVGFLYFLMKTNRFKMHCVGYANGTTVLHLSKKAIPEYELPIPNNLGLIEEYSKISNSIIQKICVNNSQIQTLSKLRDTLLPKLMKGEIRVKIDK